jgi:hypothetical protein
MKKWFKLESLAIFVLLLVIYNFLNFSWSVFVLAFFLPDISMIGYLKNPIIGAITYNIGHNYLSPILLFGLGTLINYELITALSIILAAHIALDRTLGYGLKLPTGFKDTHLGKL